MAQARKPARKPARERTRSGRRPAGGSPRPAASSVEPLKQRGSAKKPPAGDTGGRPGAAANRTAHRGGTAGASRGIKVMATQVGHYNLERKRPGDVFLIRNESEYSPLWMERVDPATPVHTTTPNQAIRKQTDAVRQQKRADMAGRAGLEGGAPAGDDSGATGDQDVLDEGED